MYESSQGGEMSKTTLMLALSLVSLNAISGINTSYFRPLDVEALHREEVANARKGEAPRYAVPQSFNLDAKARGDWEKSGQEISWSHRITAPNAVSLNFGFSRFHLPEGAQLHIYSADRTKFIRPFTSEDNNLHRELWTPVIMSDDVIIELTAPAMKFAEVELELGQVGQGFRTFGERTKSGACNVDVACSDSAGWENEINSVGVISTGGSRFCTGFMVNNTAQDRTPFFMTADHCRINDRNAASLVVYWNYQTSKCKGPRDGKLTDFQTGSVHLASGRRSDFALVRLLQAPRPEWNVTYAGWDASAAVGTPAVAIHHPNVDEKAISFEYDPTELSSYGRMESPGEGTHIRVNDWDIGTTEPGSSGSPLFNDQHRVIGQLHGGGAACGNNLPDWYGRFHTSWNGDGTLKGSLKEHLDPGKTGQLTTDTI
jgi:lysyl endopeptidase